MKHCQYFAILSAILGAGLVTFVSAQCMARRENGTMCPGGMCHSNDTECSPFSNATFNDILTCAGLGPMNMSQSREHTDRLKGLLDAAFDLHSFMRSRKDLHPVIYLFNEIRVNHSDVERFDDVRFIKAWFHVKLRPRLSSLSRQFLACMGTSNFTCQSFQALVQELSQHIETMDPGRQRMLYMYFIHPFLARNATAGCVYDGDSSEQWLVKNFGFFSALAHFRDFVTLNSNFSGLNVLQLLSPEQKAELILHPETGGLDNNTINLVFQSLLRPLLDNEHLNQSTSMGNVTRPGSHNMTGTGPAPHELDKNFRRFLKFLKPLGTFVKKFVSTIHKRNESSIESHTLTQAVVNWTLAELAGHFSRNITLGNTTIPGETPSPSTFDITSMEDWFQHVVVPALKRFLPANMTEIPNNLTAIFRHVFSLNDVMDPEPSGPPEVCRANISNSSCSISLTTESLAQGLSCVARTNLSFSVENLQLLVLELSRTLLSSSEPSNSSSVPLHLTDVFGQFPADGLTDENLGDVELIRFWFQIKLRPLLPRLSGEFLSCLSTRDFSCPAYRALVMQLSDHISVMDDMKQRLVYSHFIHRFLSRRQHSDNDCILHANNSVELIESNFGRFSGFAPLQHFFDLRRNFSALEALPALSLKQMAELVAMPYTGPPEMRDDIINRVFDHILQTPDERKLRGFLHYLEMQAREANFSCDNYRTISQRLDMAISSSSFRPPSFISASQEALVRMAPEECMRVPKHRGCTTTPVNESLICAAVNSSALQHYLNEAGNMTGMLCNFSILHFTCLPSLSQLSAQQLAELLTCKLSSNMTYSKATWKLFFTKISGNLDDALQIYSNMTERTQNQSLSHVLDVIGEIKVDQFTPQQLADAAFISRWFQKLQPFLSFTSPGFLSCLSTKNFSCDAYRAVVEALGSSGLALQCSSSPMDRQGWEWELELVYSEFIKPFLSRNDTEDQSCLNNTGNSTQWLVRNFGSFAGYAPLRDLLRLNRNFSAVDVLPLLSTRQLAELALTPGQLRVPRDVHNIMRHVEDCQLGAFFDIVSPVLRHCDLPLDVRSAMLQQVFDRANLSAPSTSDWAVQVWMQKRLRPLLCNMTEEHVEPFFKIVRHRACSISRQAVEVLSSIRPTLTNDTETAVYDQILISLREPSPLRCFRNNSFFVFLRDSFLAFPLPKLTVFLSLIPPSRKSELISSMAPPELGTFLRAPEVVDNETELCVIFNSYNRTPEFLESEDLPDDVRRPVLPCVWPLALVSDDQTEVDRWFDIRLRPYLQFLNKDIISSSDTLNASCLPFQKFVSVLGTNHSFERNSSNLTQADVYGTIKTFLNTDSLPKCYNAVDPKLNSTSWFVNYIGVFITFVTLEDFVTFGSDETLQLFTVDPENIQLFTQNSINQDVTELYTDLIFQQNPNFNPLQLPPTLQCGVPGSVYVQLDQQQSLTVLGNLNQFCADVDTEVSSALAGNIQTIDASSISNLGQAVVGLSTVQINTAPPSVIVNNIQSLSSVSGWNLGQATAIIQILITGNYQFNSASNLINLGSLVGGCPASAISSIPPQQIILSSLNPTFVTNLLSAPQVVQQAFVSQIIKVNADPTQLVAVVPDSMAAQIPRNLLIFPSSGNTTVMLQNINKKKWKQEQAVLFFDTVANGFDEPDDLSEDVLQGFTCTRVQTFSKSKMKRLIRSCRPRRNRRKVVLCETQLTCMYNQIKAENPTDYVNYPSDMLLYYNYANIQQVNCRSYFVETGKADFSVFSNTLNGRKTILLNNAKSCLGITGTTINRENVEVLGSMSCTLDQSYIQNSDPHLLEKMKGCRDFSDAQISAMETVLLNGTAKYGLPARWNENTLNQLETLPLYFSQNFWGKFRKQVKKRFLKRFLRRLRRNKTPKRKMKRLFRALTRSLRFKRSASECTEGNITQVIISDDAFPFGYDATQFSHCLSAQVAKDNLAALAEKVDDDDFQRVILDRLNEAYPSGLSDSQVLLLGSMSRVATTEDMNKWNISSVDTLSALMHSDDGEWDRDKSKAIVTKYLGVTNNTLGASELNSLAGPNLCSLDNSTLRGIASDSIRDANSLDISNCSSSQKRELFTIANAAFPISFKSRASSDVLRSYQLIQSYLGGASLDYVRSLSSANISMDIATLIGLDESVVLTLSVSEVKGLLGSNLADLKTFESEAVVRNWISRQFQSELDELNVGLTGGRANPTVTTLSGSTAAATAAAATATAAPTTVTTVSGYERSTRSAPVIFLLLGLTFILDRVGRVTF